MSITSIILLICGVASAAKPPSSNVLDRPIAELTTNPELEFVGLCEKLGVPGGMFLQAAHDLDGDTGADVRYKDTTARKILDSIIAKHPKYIWRFRDGVLLILPKGGTPELDRIIPEYSTTNTDVRYIPEGLALRAGLRPAGGSMDGFLHGPKISLSLRNIKLLDALNIAAKKIGHAVWVISRVPDSTLYQSHMNTW